MKYFTRTIDSAGVNRLALKEDWSLASLPAIEADISSLEKQLAVLPETAELYIDMTKVDKLDVCGAVGIGQLIACFGIKQDSSRYHLQNVANKHKMILQNTLKHMADEISPAHRRSLFEIIFTPIYSLLLDGVMIIAFLGEIITAFVKNLPRLHQFPYRSVLRHLDETGARAILVICVVSLLMGTILTQQIIVQLQNYGASNFVIRGVAIIILRDLAVLMVGITLAGRTVSAFTAEIGLMKVREEIDAMKVMSLQPFMVLVIPRILALMIVMPMLTILADAAALLASAVVCNIVLDFSFSYFLDTIRQDVMPKTFYLGLAKAPFIGFWMALIGCMHGLRVRADSESLGKNTTRAVVKSVLAILIIDAIFAISAAVIDF